MTGTSGRLAGTLGSLNPMRYRSYYFDSETGYYYLQSRYYDAGWGRFINADEPELLPLIQEISQSMNLFAYADNNPIAKKDTSGYIAANIVGAVVGTVIGLIGGIFLSKWLANKLKLSGWKRNVFIAGLTALIGAVAGAIGWFLGPYVAKAWSWLSKQIASLVKGSVRNVAKLSTNKMRHINVSKNNWHKIIRNPTNAKINSIMNQAIKKGNWAYNASKRVWEVTYRYNGRTVWVRGVFVKKVFQIGTSWVK